MFKIYHTRFLAAILTALFALSLSPAASAQNDYWHQRVSLFDKLPVQPGDIVFLGNSITDGGEFQELFNREDVKNRGIVGDIINGVRKRLDQVTNGHPSKIFLLIGINDVSHGHSPEKIAAMYETLVSEIHAKSPETQLYIQSLLPINNDYRRYKNLIGKEKVVPAVNALLPEIAEKYGAVYVDLWPGFATADGKLSKEYTTDGLHLSGAGYKRWAAMVKDLLDNDTPANSSQTADADEDTSVSDSETIEEVIEMTLPSIKKHLE